MTFTFSITAHILYRIFTLHKYLQMDIGDRVVNRIVKCQFWVILQSNIRFCQLLSSLLFSFQHKTTNNSRNLHIFFYFTTSSNIQDSEYIRYYYIHTYLWHSFKKNFPFPPLFFWWAKLMKASSSLALSSFQLISCHFAQSSDLLRHVLFDSSPKF